MIGLYTAGRIVVRRLAPQALVAIAASLLWTAPGNAAAGYFRGGHFIWTPSSTAPNTVEFTATVTLQRDAFSGTASDGHPAVGDVFVDNQGRIFFGDGAITPSLVLKTLAVDLVSNSLTARVLDPVDPSKLTVTHFYPRGFSPLDATLEGCCRILELANGRNRGYRLATFAEAITGNSSPFSTLPDVVRIQPGSNSWSAQGADPDPGAQLRYYIAEREEMGSTFIRKPPNLAVDENTGELTLTTDPLVHTVGSLWATQIVIEDIDPFSGDPLTSVARDYLIQVITCSGNTPPAFAGETPANGSTFVVEPGQNVAFTVTAGDVNNQSVQVSSSGVPAGATITPPFTASGNPASVEFSWTPTSADLGTHVVSFTANDGCASISNSYTIEVNEAPDCSGAHALISDIWPPNHMLSPVTIVGVTDANGDAVSLHVTGVTMDEPINGNGDGNTCPDAVINADGSASVRQERHGRYNDQAKNGRVYHVSFVATDTKGASCEGAVDVCIAHDQSVSCVDDGQYINALGPCLDPNKMSTESARPLFTFDLKVLEVSPSQALLEYSLPASGDVSLVMFDVAGRRLGVVDAAAREAGIHQVSWNASGVARGVYFARLTAGGTTITRTVLKTR